MNAAAGPQHEATAPSGFPSSVGSSGLGGIIAAVASAEPFAAGSTALREGRWRDARTELEAALAEEETGEILEGLAEACWWLCDARASVRYREQAWVKFRQAGDLVRAGRAAIDLSLGYLVNLGNDAAAGGGSPAPSECSAMPTPIHCEGGSGSCRATCRPMRFRPTS